jgi:hypothetical protein
MNLDFDEILAWRAKQERQADEFAHALLARGAPPTIPGVRYNFGPCAARERVRSGRETWQ